MMPEDCDHPPGYLQIVVDDHAPGLVRWHIKCYKCQITYEGPHAYKRRSQ